ncbi:hypothetical protein OE88DRAFT_1737855 [Heliocybe sulcata]|uniref:Uncharacterized protein n=1 Tax=Heliocybe sulcata TaxID=5364 RepID=A0A5C3MSX0_9AGAM|nr:hypothetical protein OE88DRAFT_1737855 [Heliocybe sulcata]
MAASVYARQLLGLGYGHALWEPNPGEEYRQIEIGDVGFIQAGFFHRLLNVLLPEDDPSQKWGAPEHYEPLRLPFPDYKWIRHPLRGYFHSTSVKVLSTSLSASGGIVASGSARVSFGCTKESGAALVLPEDTVRQDAHFGRWFREYALKHYPSWLAFANNTLGFDIDVSDLILVTGRDLTTQWAMAAFAKSEFRGTLAAGVSVPGMLTAEFEVRSGWRADLTGGVQHRCGPQPSRLPVPQCTTDVQNESSQVKQNQCIFLRGYRVKERRFLNPKVIKAASEPSDLGKEDRGKETHSLAASQSCDSEYSVDVEALSGNTKDANLLDPVLDYILDKSTARVAIAHDEDFWPYLHGLLALSPETAVITVDENGVGRLVARPGPIELHSVLSEPTHTESPETLARPMTSRASQASLSALPKRTVSDPVPWSSEEKAEPEASQVTKKSSSLTAPFSKIGAYFKQRSLRKSPSNPDFAMGLRHQSSIPNPVKEDAGRHPESWGRRHRAISSRREMPSQSVRRLATIEDAQEDTGLPDEYRLDVPPPYELDIPEQYQANVIS